MSVWAQAWAYEQRLGKWREIKGKRTWKGDPGAKSVLAAVATFADETGYAYCGQDTLAEMTDMTERSVREHLHNLEHAYKKIRREHRRKGSGRGKGEFTSDGIWLLAPAHRLRPPRSDDEPTEKEPPEKFAVGEKRAYRRKNLPPGGRKSFPGNRKGIEPSGDPSDTKEAASLACTILEGLMQTEDRLATVWDHPPIMWPFSSVSPDFGPMQVLEERARELEDELADILAVNVLAGFPYADVPEAGVSFSAVTTGDLDLSRNALRELNVIASSLRGAGTPSLIPVEQAMARLEYEDEGPVLLVEPSDNVGAGAAGDATHVLRALVEHDVPESGVIINDPQTVAALAGAKPGDIRTVEIGGKSGEIGAEPLPLEVELVSLGDGRFVPEDQSVLYVQREVDMGDCAVVRHGGITILLTSCRTPPIDLGQWRSQGVDPEGLFGIALKAATEHRRAYLPIARTSYVLDLPGPCADNLELLPFQNVARPVYPLDGL